MPDPDPPVRRHASTSVSSFFENVNRSLVLAAVLIKGAAGNCGYANFLNKISCEFCIRHIKSGNIRKDVIRPFGQLTSEPGLYESL